MCFNFRFIAVFYLDHVSTSRPSGIKVRDIVLVSFNSRGGDVVQTLRVLPFGSYDGALKL